MGRWNKSNFRVLTLAIDVYNELKGLKLASPDSFADVIRRILKEKRAKAWSVALPVAHGVKQFWLSDLFGGKQQ